MTIKNIFKTKLRNSSTEGSTQIISIPKHIIESLKLISGYEIIVNINRVEDVKLLCKCLHCGGESISDSNDIFCKKCGSEDMEILKEEVDVE